MALPNYCVRGCNWWQSPSWWLRPETVFHLCKPENIWNHSRTILPVTFRESLINISHHWYVCSSTFVPLKVGSPATSMSVLSFRVFSRHLHMSQISPISNPLLRYTTQAMPSKLFSPPQTTGREKTTECSNSCPSWIRKMEILYLNMKLC